MKIAFISAFCWQIGQPLVYFQFHTIHSIHSFKIHSKLEIMETYWCMKKNSIIDMIDGKKLPLALTPCLKSGCDRWDDGECIQIRKAGKIIACS